MTEPSTPNQEVFRGEDGTIDEPVNDAVSIDIDIDGNVNVDGDVDSNVDSDTAVPGEEGMKEGLAIDISKSPNMAVLGAGDTPVMSMTSALIQSFAPTMDIYIIAGPTFGDIVRYQHADMIELREHYEGNGRPAESRLLIVMESDMKAAMNNSSNDNSDDNVQTLLSDIIANGEDEGFHVLMCIDVQKAAGPLGNMISGDGLTSVLDRIENGLYSDGTNNIPENSPLAALSGFQSVFVVGGPQIIEDEDFYDVYQYDGGSKSHGLVHKDAAISFKNADD